MALEVKGNDYFSVQPELGVAFNYSQPVGVKSHFKASLTAAYTNELGEVNDVRNKARLKGTTADYYELRGDKEDRKGNGKFDLNIGFDNTRFGVTVNAGYDTKGENIRGGIGFRAIY
ncbi:MAG: autotransporter domain-containing protein [Leptotrichia sp.]|nr:autotransporter domain-containing protein [Leptotrichia sp.]